MNLTDIQPHELVQYLPNPRKHILDTVAAINAHDGKIKRAKKDISTIEGVRAYHVGVFEDAVINDYTDEQIEFAKRMVMEKAIADQQVSLSQQVFRVNEALMAARRRVGPLVKGHQVVVVGAGDESFVALHDGNVGKCTYLTPALRSTDELVEALNKVTYSSLHSVRI